MSESDDDIHIEIADSREEAFMIIGRKDGTVRLSTTLEPLNFLAALTAISMHFASDHNITPAQIMAYMRETGE